MRRILQRWMEMGATERGLSHGLALSAALYLLHYTLYSFWYIEDAAISFAFARHAASGEGFVAYPGGERVEGFSNPLWTLLLTAFDLVGVSPWIAAKLMGMVFGLLTLAVALAWTRRIIEPRHPAVGAVLAPVLLALSPQFVLWNASGLENSLFSLLLGLGAWRTLVESRDGGTPWSALAWAGLAMTRPEAPLYAAVGGCVGFALHLRERGVGSALRWGVAWNAIFGLVFGGWFAWRFAYFAWPFPNTYYAKLGETDPMEVFKWSGKGWKYLRNYAIYTGAGLLLPVYALGQTGLARRRGTLGLLLCGVGVVLVSVTSAQSEALLANLRVGFLGLGVPLLLVVGMGRAGAAARSLAWILGAVALFFAVFSGGDWMRGYRWLSMASVPMAVLLADAILMIAQELRSDPDEPPWRQWLSWGVPRGMFAYAAGASVVSAGIWIARPETSPYDVSLRVRHMQYIASRLHLDHVSLLEVDMGAHMWWSGFELVDIAGLVDVPIAHHDWEDAFVQDYIYEERAPLFAHVHPTGGWGDRAHLRRPRGWRDYVEVAPYPISPRTQHIGSNVRRELLFQAGWQGPTGRAVGFAPTGQSIALVSARLEGWDVVAPEVMAGGELFLEVGLRRLRPGPELRLIAFLRRSGEREVVSWELPPAYDWVPQQRWTARETAVGRHSLALPAHLEPGLYDLGFVLTSGDLGVLAALDASENPVFAFGERRFPGAVEVVPEEQARALAQTRLDEALLAAGEGDCERAERGWGHGRRHLAEADPWQVVARERIAEALALCLAERAATQGEDAQAAADIRLARRWGHRLPRVLEVGELLADRWQAQGEVARDEDDGARALELWTWALGADPSRSWLRRSTEEVRDEVLQLGDNAEEKEE